MPLYAFKCENCNAITESIESIERGFIYCPECLPDDPNQPGHKALKTLSTFGTYSIKGNNSASITPKKFRGGRPS